MAEGGFLVKFGGKEVARCYAVAFDYDELQCVINDTEIVDTFRSNRESVPGSR